MSPFHFYLQLQFQRWGKGQACSRYHTICESAIHMSSLINHVYIQFSLYKDFLLVLIHLLYDNATVSKQCKCASTVLHTVTNCCKSTLKYQQYNHVIVKCCHCKRFKWKENCSLTVCFFPPYCGTTKASV